jgi:hypothetical protein
VNWLWNPKDYLTLDWGNRVDIPGEPSFIPFEDEEQFAPLAQKLALVAAEQVRHYRDLFPTVEAAAANFHPANDLQRALDTGVALALVGETARARRVFAEYIDWFESDQELEWRTEFDEEDYDRVKRLSDLAADQPRVREQIIEDLLDARAQLMLSSDMHVPYMPAAP